MLLPAIRMWQNEYGDRFNFVVVANGSAEQNRLKLEKVRSAAGARGRKIKALKRVPVPMDALMASSLGLTVELPVSLELETPRSAVLSGTNARS
jgi:hypothetical protein